MKQQVYMKLLEQMEEAVKDNNMIKLRNLAAKSYILRKGGTVKQALERMNSSL